MESFRQFHSLIRAARFDEELFALIAHPASRQRLREVLISSYFDAATGSRLAQRAMENRQAFAYSEYLLQQSPTPRVQEPPLAGTGGEYVRDQAFRRAVIVAYDRRCGLCGIKIVTLDGRTAVDAAHIKPWRESHDPAGQRHGAVPPVPLGLRRGHAGDPGGLRGADFAGDRQRGEYRGAPGDVERAADCWSGGGATLAGCGGDEWHRRNVFRGR